MNSLFPGRWDEFPLKIDVRDVLSRSQYWEGESEHEYLAIVLPRARQFLLTHEGHDLVFGDHESFMNFDSPDHDYLEWLDAASLQETTLQTICLEPRYFAEHPLLAFRSWTQVEHYCEQHCCGWTGIDTEANAAKEVFMRTVASKD